MNSLKIRTGQVSLQILGDDEEVRGVFKFNPEDVQLAKQFLSLQHTVNEKQAEFENRIATCETTEQQAALLLEIVTYFEGLIDQTFGEGSSKILFGDNKSITMFTDFIEGITPYFAEASKNRVAKYKK